MTRRGILTGWAIGLLLGGVMAAALHWVWSPDGRQRTEFLNLWINKGELCDQ